MTVEIQDAEHRLSQLAETAATGEDVILLVSGKPLARIVPWMPGAPTRKLGCFDGKYDIPDDIDTMFEKEIQEMFHGESEA